MQALKEYQRGLEVLVCRRHGEEIWDLVVWEYCTTLYTFASILHDRFTHSVMVCPQSKQVIDSLPTLTVLTLKMMLVTYQIGGLLMPANHARKQIPHCKH